MLFAEKRGSKILGSELKIMEERFILARELLLGINIWIVMR